LVRVGGRNRQHDKASCLELVLEAMERDCELFGYVADGTNRKIDGPHASRNPQNAVRDVVLLRETPDGKERMGGEHA
jgi:hypothetical protein